MKVSLGLNAKTEVSNLTMPGPKTFRPGDEGPSWANTVDFGHSLGAKYAPNALLIEHAVELAMTWNTEVSFCLKRPSMEVKLMENSMGFKVKRPELQIPDDCLDKENVDGALRQFYTTCAARYRANYDVDAQAKANAKKKADNRRGQRKSVCGI